LTKHHFRNKSYITGNGDWGTSDQVIIFDPDMLSVQQWKNLDNLPDGAKLVYVREILTKRNYFIRAIEKEYQQPLTVKEDD
jgi:hypothetical protein